MDPIHHYIKQYTINAQSPGKEWGTTRKSLVTPRELPKSLHSLGTSIESLLDLTQDDEQLSATLYAIDTHINDIYQRSGKRGVEYLVQRLREKESLLRVAGSDGDDQMYQLADALWSATKQAGLYLARKGERLDAKHMEYLGSYQMPDAENQSTSFRVA